MPALVYMYNIIAGPESEEMINVRHAGLLYNAKGLYKPLIMLYYMASKSNKLGLLRETYNYSSLQNLGLYTM